MEYNNNNCLSIEHDCESKIIDLSLNYKYNNDLSFSRVGIISIIIFFIYKEEIKRTYEIR